jgi:hypothetical protein
MTDSNFGFNGLNNGLNNSASDNYNVVSYITGDKPKKGSEFRLAKITFKTDKQTGIKADSKAVELPIISANEISNNAMALIPAITNMLASVQDSIIRENIENGKKFISITDISIPNLIAYLASESKGERLSKEYLNNWFDSELLEPLTIAISEKIALSGIATDKQLDVINDTVNAYKVNIAKLASPNTNFDDSIKAMLIKALNFASDNAIAITLINKLNVMVKPTVQLMAL